MSEAALFPDCWKVLSVVPESKIVGEWSIAKNYHPVSLLSVVSKVFEKLVNNRIVHHLEKCGFFLISSMVLGLLNQLQIFLQLYLIELLGFIVSSPPFPFCWGKVNLQPNFQKKWGAGRQNLNF